jgi:hypothetical protein
MAGLRHPEPARLGFRPGLAPTSKQRVRDSIPTYVPLYLPPSLPTYLPPALHDAHLLLIRAASCLFKFHRDRDRDCRDRDHDCRDRAAEIANIEIATVTTGTSTCGLVPLSQPRDRDRYRMALCCAAPLFVFDPAARCDRPSRMASLVPALSRPIAPSPRTLPQEGLDGPTVARFAAQHGMRPEPAGPRRRPAAGPGRHSWRSVGFSSLNLSRHLGGAFDRRHRGIGCEGDGPGSDAGPGAQGDDSEPRAGPSQTADSLLGPVAAALPDWWHADPAQRPPAGVAAELLEQRAAAAAEAAAAAGSTSTAAVRPAPRGSSSWLSVATERAPPHGGAVMVAAEQSGRNRSAYIYIYLIYVCMYSI